MKVVKDEIWELVKELNNSWINKDFKRLESFFDENAIILTSTLQKMAQGKTACVKSYEDFSTKAIVTKFDQFAPIVNLFDSVAIINYSFTIRYEMEGLEKSEGGSEVFVLNKNKSSEWQVISRIVHFSE